MKNLGEVKPWAALSWPNRVTLIRLVLVPPYVVLLMNQHRWQFARYLALSIFVVMGLSDYLDGVLARRMNARTRLGAILDPLADKALIICSAVLLSLDDSAVEGAQLANYVVVAIVGKDLWVIGGFLVIYLVTDKFRVRPTWVGKVCTFAQIVMVGFVLIAPDLNHLVGGLGSKVARIAGWAVSGLCVLAVVSYTRLGLRYVAQEEKPLDENNHDVNRR